MPKGGQEPIRVLSEHTPPVTLREYIDRVDNLLQVEIQHRYAIMQSELDRRFADSKEQLTIYRTAMEKRLDGMNEFRRSNNDTLNRMASRELVEQQIAAISSRIDRLEDWRNILAGTQKGQHAVVSEQRSRIAMITAGAGAILLAIAIVVTVILTLTGHQVTSPLQPLHSATVQAPR